MSMSKNRTHLINHVGLVIDDSGSMRGLEKAVIRVVDELIKGLAEDSKKMGQETRVSVWAFGSDVRNIVWDQDVFHFPSIADSYVADGMATALVSGTIIALQDLQEIPMKYGKHAVLTYVVTDGGENHSHRVSRLHNRQTLEMLISGLPDNWTVGILVPDTNGVHHAKSFGFPAGNIQRWDATSERGIEEAGATLRASTQSYMTNRSIGTHGTKTLFADSSKINDETVKNLVPADPSKYILHFIPPVTHPFPKALKNRKTFRIDEYIMGTLGLTFQAGANYYELIRSERVQANKKIAVQDKQTGALYIGREARTLIGLPDNADARLRPVKGLKHRVFVQSDSTNRNLREGQHILVVR